MTIWYWLGNNSSQIQAVAGVATVVVAIAVGWVAWKQKKAAETQADAAREQAVAAKEQASAATEQVIAAKQQTATSLLIADRQSSPQISITAATTRDGQIIRQRLAILNSGSGAALNVELKYKDGLPGDDDLGITGKTLVVRDSLPVKLTDEGRAAKSGLRLTYETIFGTKYILEFQWNATICQATNQKLFTASEIHRKH
jgi:hypothetical protein